jgi:hypothetical protein
MYWREVTQLKGKEGKGTISSVVIIASVVLAGVASAQPIVITISDLIQIIAEPASIPADGKSTSEIKIAVFWPELEELGDLCGTPAGHTQVIVVTTRGILADAEDMNSTGKDIEVFTGDNGVASVLLSGNETGVADITARATGIEAMMNDYLANETTVYVVKNSTTATLLETQVCGWRFELKEGKDYVSLPAIPADADPDAVFGVDIEVKGYDTETGWYTPTELEAGKGYLIRCAEPKTKDVHGISVEGRTWADIKEDIQSGWNLVGIGDTDVTIGDNLEVIGWDAVADNWVTLHKGDILRRGSGYWIEWP